MLYLDGPRDAQDAFRRSPFAAYSQATPYRLLTGRPFTLETRDHPAPDLMVGQVAVQWPPVTLPTTATRAEIPRRTLTELEVEGPIRRFTPAHAGVIVVVAGVGGVGGFGAGALMVEPPSANRQAK